MAQHASAEKRNRQNIKRRARNAAWRARIRTALKKARTAVESGASDKDTLVKAAVETVYRAASQNILPKASASRTVSRLMKRGAKAS